MYDIYPRGMGHMEGSLEPLPQGGSTAYMPHVRHFQEQVSSYTGDGAGRPACRLLEDGTKERETSVL